MFDQLTYGLLIATNLLTNAPAFNTSSNRPYLDIATQAELYEAVTERRAACMEHEPGYPALTNVTVTNLTYAAGYWHDALAGNAYIYSATGVYSFLSFSKWRYLATDEAPFVFPFFDLNTDVRPFYPFIRRGSLSWYLFLSACAMTEDNAPHYYQTVTATSATPWTAEALGVLSTNIWPNLTVGKVTALHSALTNQAVTKAAAVSWSGPSIPRLGTNWYKGATGSWDVCELATGVVSTLDVSLVVTQAIDISSNYVFAVTQDLSFAASPVNHLGPSTNRLAAGSVVMPVDANPDIYYEATFPRVPVQRWQFLRCPP